MSKNLLRFRVAFMLVGSMLLALLGGSGAIAQGVTTSSINGVVTDDKGAVLPGATVVAVHTPSGTRYGITTNTAGRYTFPAVRIGGPYRITVSFVGFQEQTREIGSADLGNPVQASFRLAEQGQALSEVVVTAGGLVDAERTGASTNIKRESFERLPSLNRSFQDFSALTPQAGPGFSFGGRSNLYNNFSIDGATSNNVFGLSATPGGQTNAQPIGVDAIQEINVALAPYDVSQGSFTGAGVNAVTRSGTNEFQGSVYGFTKNQSLVNKKVEGVDSPVANFQYNNFGARVGGPLIKNKLFFFLNAEYEKSTTPGVVYPATPIGTSAPGIQQTAANLENLRNFLVTPDNGKSWTFDPGTYGQFDVPIQSVKFLAKIDWNISDQHKFTIRYNQLNSFRDQTISSSGSLNGNTRSNSVNSLPFSKSWYRQFNNLSNIIAELNSTFANGKFANNLQFGYSAFRDYRETGGGGAAPNFPTVDILGTNGSIVTTFGPDPFTPNNRLNQDVYQLNDKFDMFLGNHNLTLGTANEFYHFANVFTQQINGVYTFNSVDEFIANATSPATTNTPLQYNIQYSAVPGNPAPAADWKAAQLGFYAQDAYTGIKNLRLTLGIRLDIPSFPNRESYTKNLYTDSLSFAGDEKIYLNQLPKSTPLWSPRIGFNWDIKGNKSVQLRGGTGIFTGRIPFVWISNQLSNNGVFFGSIAATRAGVGTSGTAQYPFSPNTTQYVPELTGRPGYPLGASFSINATTPNFKFPQVWRSSIAVDKTLPGGFVGTLEAIYTKDINAVLLRDANMSGPVGTLAGDGRPLYGAASGDGSIPYTNPNDIRINDRVIQALVLDNTNKGYALSLTAQIQKTSGRLNGSLAYTYTDSKDISSQQGSTASGIYTGNAIVTNPNLPNLSYANNWFPHRVVGYVSYRLNYLQRLASTFSFIYEGRAGGNFSYVYNGNPNSDGTARISGNDLIYVPRNQNEILLTTTNAADTRTPQQIWDQLNNYIQQDSYLSKHRGQYAERNGALLPWYHSLNFRFLQDFSIKAGGKRNTLQFSYEVINVLNLLNSNWGLLKSAARTNLLNFVGYETPHTATSPTTGRPVYAFATNTDGSALSNSYVNNVQINGPTLNSRWQMQLGLRYIFN